MAQPSGSAIGRHWARKERVMLSIEKKGTNTDEERIEREKGKIEGGEIKYVEKK